MGSNDPTFIRSQQPPYLPFPLAVPAIAMRTKVWIFGYGSLVWNPGFVFEQRQVGYIRGWTRRFYQGSTDHRGSPGSPGRVATLVADAQSVCWGVAYQVTGESLISIFSYLDEREQGGFRRHQVDFYPKAGPANAAAPSVTTAFVYIAQDDNPHYLGPASIPEMALQIFHSRGPSGSNRDYLFRLAESLRDMGVTDEHVSELEHSVRQLGAHSKDGSSG